MEILDAFALVICRENADTISRNILDSIGVDSFDYETLFADGAFHIGNIQKSVGKEMIDLICSYFPDTAAVLSEFAQSSHEGALSISEGASRLMIGLLKPKAPSFVYVPFGGDAFAPIWDRSCCFHMEVSDDRTTRFTKLVIIANGPANYSITCSNPFLSSFEDRPKYRSIYIPAMPFGLRMTGLGRKHEERFALNMIKLLQDSGRMVIALPASALSSDLYYEFRKTIVEKQYLRQVIILGRGLYKTAAFSSVIFVIEKSLSASDDFDLINAESIPLKNDDAFYDLLDKINSKASDISYPIRFSQILSSSNLSIRALPDSGVRIDRPGYKYVKLAEVLRPYSNNVSVDMENLVARLSGKDMHINLPQYQIGIQDVALEHIMGRFNCITENVFCFHSITLNNLWCAGEPDLPIYCNQDIYTYTLLDPLITPEYLSFALAEEDVRAEIKNRLTGSVIPRITKREFLDVEIPYPDTDRRDFTLQEVERFISDRKSRLSFQMQETQRESLEDIKDDIEDKKHLLGPYNFSVQAGYNRLIKLLEKGHSLSADTKVFDDSDICLVDYLRTVLNKSQSAGYITTTIGGAIFEQAITPIDSFTFLQEYLDYLRTDIAYRGIEFTLCPIQAPYPLLITPRTLTFVLDTVVRNAVRHGFSDSFWGDKKIRISITGDYENGEAILSVANNGEPASPEFSQKLYEDKFGKCGDNANTGRGGYFVSRAMNHYHGTVAINTSDKEWPFIVELHIPMSHE